MGQRSISNSFDYGYLVVLAICLILIWPFLSREGLPQETDAELHVFRLHELGNLVQGGELYPRWAPNFYHGYGYPIFNYYAPLSYYLGLTVELWSRFDAVDGVKAVFIASQLAAAVGMYGFVRDNWGRRAGYVAAAVYVYSPYIQYIDPHARGVLPETLSLGLFPLALWSLDRLHRDDASSNWATSIILIAAVILAHNLMALLFFGLLFAWSLWIGFTPAPSLRRTPAAGSERRAAGRSAGIRLVAALLLGLGLASFFWLPVYLERNAVNLNTLVGQGDNYDFRTHFLTISELFAPSKRLDWSSTEPDFAFNLGVSQWVTGGLGIMFLLAGRVRHSRKLLFFTLSLALMLLMMLPASTPIWEAVPFLPYFQFPWRLLGAADAMLAVLAGAALSSLLSMLESRSPRSSQKRLSRVVSTAPVTVAFVAFPIVLGLPLSQPSPWPDFGEVSTLRMSLIENSGRWLGTTSTADYVPSTVDVIPERNGAVVQGIYEGTPLDRVNRAPGMIPDSATVTARFVRPLLTEYDVMSPEDFLLRLFLFDFPGWQVRVDGEPVDTELGRPEGFIVVPMPAGKHVVEVEFGSTPARTAATAISFVSLALSVAVVWSARRRTGAQSGRSGQAPGTVTSLAEPFRDRLILIAILALIAVHLLLLQPLGWLHYASAPYTAEPADVTLFRDFGEQIALIGYDVSSTRVSPGEVFEIGLYWQAQRPLGINYQAFVHLLAQNGAPVAQSDKLNPGEYPTKRWPVDKYVRDVHRLKIPEDLPGGLYSLTTGLWVQSDGWRLPLFDAYGQQIGDNAPILELTVEE